MIPHDKLEVGVHYWAFVKRNRQLAVVCLHRPYGEPKGIMVKGTDQNLFRQQLEEYVFIAPCLAGADVMDEASTLRIQHADFRS